MRSTSWLWMIDGNLERARARIAEGGVMLYFAILYLWLGFSVVAGAIASEKGRNPFVWFFRRKT